jgi:hypothetical protein
MKWKMSEKPRTVLANPSLIREFVDMEPAPYDRPLSERRLQIYERILQMGEFRPVVWASATCGETNCTYRVNGKHTATMLSGILGAKKPLPEFYVTVERYECDRLTDVANLYNTFDSALGSRNTRDINASFASAIPELKDISFRIVTNCVSAIAYHRWTESELKLVPAAEKAEQLMDNIDFVVWVGKTFTATTVGVASQRHVTRVPVVQAMYATHSRAKSPADTFWKKVRDESDPDRDNPTRVLARYLMRTVISGGHTSRVSGKNKVVSAREIYVKCLHAWNAWRKGEATALNYHAKADIPKVV